MALVKCKQCGQMISEKAAQCPKCGAKTTDKRLCPECGSFMEAYAPVCPSCGCPNSVQGKDGQDTLSPNLSDKDRVEERVQDFLIENKKYLPASKIDMLRQLLLSLNTGQLYRVECLNLKDPVLMVVLSVLVGWLGIDRFVLGQVAKGILKLLLPVLIIVIFCISLGIVYNLTTDYGYIESYFSSPNNYLFVGFCVLYLLALLVDFLWWLIDIFRISHLTKKHNLRKIQKLVYSF